MIVCMCKALSENAIVDAARAGMTAGAIASATGAGTDCGCCAETIASIVNRVNGPEGGSCGGCPARCRPGRSEDPRRDAA